MDVARIREGIRKMRFSTILDRWDAGEVTQEMAAELLGMSVRSFQRWRERYEAEGEAGLVDRRGGPSPKRSPQEEVERMLGLYRDKYADFTVKHFHEQLTRRHNYKLGYTVTKSHLHRAGLVRPAPKRSAHRKKRPRRPMRGMMLHQDGSRHVWALWRPQYQQRQKKSARPHAQWEGSDTLGRISWFFHRSVSLPEPQRLFPAPRVRAGLSARATQRHFLERTRQFSSGRVRFRPT